jgi:hypothetical protein
MNPDKAKALQNSLKRPVRTSRLNPYVMNKTPHGEIRVAPRQYPDTLPRVTKAMSEAKAYYATGKDDARSTAAGMLRNFRKTKSLSRSDTAALVEFARGDYLAKDVARQGLSRTGVGKFVASIARGDQAGYSKSRKTLHRVWGKPLEGSPIPEQVGSARSEIARRFWADR